MAPAGTVDLYWIPLGAGAHIVRRSGKLYEGLVARVHRREACDLYHSALMVSLPEGTYAIEQAPVPDGNGDRRGVVAEGPVGIRSAGRFRVFRYEVRCWRGGSIPDIDKAVASPVRLTDELGLARRVVEVGSFIPTPIWGRDELGAGEMWNSNSVIGWILARSGMDLVHVHPPAHGRAPGWTAGVRVAARTSDPPDVRAA